MFDGTNVTADSNSSNITTIFADDSFAPNPSFASVFKSIVYILMIAVGIGVNSLSVCVLIKTKEVAVSENSKLFLTCLNISDLFNCIVGVFPNTYNIALDFKVWAFPQTFCSMYVMLTNFALAASYYFIVAIAVDRYIAVVYALRYQELFTKRKAWCVTVAILIFSALLQFNGEHYEYLAPTGGCWFALLDRQTAVSHTIAVTLVSVVPFFIIIGLYVRIMLIARQHSRQIAAQDPSSNDSGSDTQGNRRKADHKGTVTFLLITGVFGLTFLPYYTAILYVVVNIQWPASGWVFVLKLSGISNTWLNALIYYFRNKWFQNELKSLLFCWRHQI